MTARDVRAAAQAEADKRIGGVIAHTWFVEGAVFGAALVTPSREQIAEAVASAQNVPFVGRKQERIADAVLALMGES